MRKQRFPIRPRAFRYQNVKWFNLNLFNSDSFTLNKVKFRTSQITVCPLKNTRIHVKRVIMDDLWFRKIVLSFLPISQMLNLGHVVALRENFVPIARPLNIRNWEIFHTDDFCTNFHFLLMALKYKNEIQNIRKYNLTSHALKQKEYIKNAVQGYESDKMTYNKWIYFKPAYRSLEVLKK